LWIKETEKKKMKSGIRPAKGYSRGGKKMMSPTLSVSFSCNPKNPNSLCFLSLQDFANTSTLRLSPTLPLRCSQVFSSSIILSFS